MKHSPRARLARRVAVALFVLAVGLAALAVGCRGGGGGGDVKDVDAAELLRRAAERMDGVRSMRFLLEHQNGKAEILNGLLMERAEGAVAGADRLTVEVLAQAGPLNAKIGIVILPDQSWITNPLTGRWERQQVTIASLFDPASGVTALMRSVTSPRVTGREQAGVVDAYVVEAKVDSGELALFASGAPSGRELTAKAWIGVADPLVHRIEVTGAITTAEPANLVRRLTLRDFGAEIAIEPPR
ncbi:MAG: LppX_LprAFG lipoprotein [Chloroflexi bacterium]|nr:LppX_LprAFG lipoprotein [Chloroflexota bacterium]